MAALERQVVLVSGCSTGIGRALVRALASAGHRPFASARSLASVADLAAAGIDTVALDVNDLASIGAAVDAVVAKAGRIDVLVNNAGVNVFGPILEVPVQEIRGVFETNVLGLLALTQAVFPHMAGRRAGRIINLGSVVGLVPTPFAGGYCATKSAVHMLSDVMRMEVKPFGIDVVVVQPGGVRSSFADSSSRELERFRAPTSRYRGAYAGIRKRAFASQESPMPAEDFAGELVAQAFAEVAPRIVRLGTGATALSRLADLDPARRDALLSATYGLQELADDE